MSHRLEEWTKTIDEVKDEIKGKKLEEITEKFGNELRPIAFMPEGYLQFLDPSITDNRVYCGFAYFLDHAVNHHLEVDPKKYLEIQNIIDTADDVRLDNKNKSRNPSILFIKNVGKQGVVIVSFNEEENGKILLHKSFIEKLKPNYLAKMQDIKLSTEVDHSSISPEADSASAAGSLSALDDNNQSLTENVKNVNEDEKRLNQYREWVNVQPVELPKLKRNATQEEIKQAADEAITKLLDAFTITDSSGSKHILSEPFEKSLRTAQTPLLIEIAQKVNELIHEERHNEELYEANKKDIPTYKKSKLIQFITRELPYVHTGHSNGVTLRELKRGILLFQKELGEISDGVYKSAISFIDKNGADKFNDNVLAEIIKEEEAANTQAEQEQEQQTKPKFDLTPENFNKIKVKVIHTLAGMIDSGINLGRVADSVINSFKNNDGAFDDNLIKDTRECRQND